MADYHWIFDAAFTILSGVGVAAGVYIGLRIDNAMLRVNGLIEKHIAECNIIREDNERRLTKLEEGRRHVVG